MLEVTGCTTGGAIQDVEMRREEEWHVTRYDGYVTIAFPPLRSSLTHLFLSVPDVITLEAHW